MLAMKSSVAVRAPKVASRRTSVVVRADGFIGSSTNLIMIASTTATLTAARLGFAPTVKKQATAGLKLVEGKNAAGVISNDPSGFTIVDVLAMGAAGHGIGVGIVLGLKGIGAL
ncbi:Photosystem I reaction center subunit psaK, chloroplastic [Tetrabaena socialis]|uniref:Photosystem I reaction center subunit psaK, chloroplastic n=1 Tax=Tetrabaena socialis TaxID=47790 RepID=A0A2J7ZLJ2_9CHLO|nr:Photosystem I reaction center subunit psaK, chloroplastic [Tetrabaena socialis]|eukprot:PNH01137.1 Photosystem I reaction center subunit psaK, chloroplastic [Tetrabaena socialis]